jgi:hypothetical protein
MSLSFLTKTSMESSMFITIKVCHISADHSQRQSNAFGVQEGNQLSIYHHVTFPHITAT